MRTHDCRGSGASARLGFNQDTPKVLIVGQGGMADSKIR